MNTNDSSNRESRPQMMSKENKLQPPGEGVQKSPAEKRDLNLYAEFSAARQFVNTKFGRVAVVENGSGPAAVFLHGFPLNGYHWRYQLTELADSRRCIAIDLMGLGHTEVLPGQSLTFSAQADMVLSTLDAMGVETFELVGNDTGGAVAQMVAVKQPARVRSLVLTNTDAHDNYPPKALSLVHDAAVAGTLDELFLGFLDNPELARQGMGALVYENPTILTADLLDIYLSPITKNERRRKQINEYIATQDASETVAIKPDLEKLMLPTLILWANADPFFGLEWAHWLKRTISGAQDKEIIEFDQAKLFFTEERAAEVTSYIRQHWSVID